MRHALKICAWVVGTMLLMIGVLGGTVFIAGNTAGGRAQIERITERLSGGRVRVTGLAGDFPTALECTRLELRDQHGTWLTADHVLVRWSPLALLARHVQVDSLRASRVLVERRPIPISPDDKESATPRIDVADFSVESLQLGSALVGTPASLTLRGGVHLRSLRDASAHVLARRIDGPGNYELTLRFDPARMDATLDLHEPGGGPLASLLGMPGLGDLSVKAALNGARSAERIQVALEAGAIRGRVQGVVDLPGESVDVSYEIDAPAAAPRPGLAWQRLSLSGNWRGPFTAPIADARLLVDQLQLSGGVRLTALNANLSAKGGLLAVHALADGLAIPRRMPAKLMETPLAIDASMRLDDATRPLELTANHALFALHANAITAGEPSAKISVHLPDLGSLTALGGVDLKGAADFNAQLTRVRAETRLTLDGNAALTGGAAIWTSALGNSARLQMSAALADRSLRVERLLLNGRALSLSLSGDTVFAARSAADMLDKTHARWDLGVSDLSRFSSVLAGTLKLSGQMHGVAADAVLTSTVSVRGSPPGTVSADLHAKDLLKSPAVALRARGTFDSAPLHIQSAMSWDSSGGLHLVVDRVGWKSLSITGEVASGAATSQGRGQLRLNWEQLADLNALLGASMRGRVAGSLTLAQSDRGFLDSQVQLRLDGSDLMFGGFAGTAQLQGSGALDDLRLELAAQSPDVAGGPASLSSNAELRLSSGLLHVASAQALYRARTLRLLSPADLSFKDGLSTPGVKLGLRDAVLEVSGQVLPLLDLQASLHRVKPALVNAFIPNLLAEGTIDAEAKLSGTVAAPTGRVELDASGLRVAGDEAADLPVVALHAVAQLMGDTARVDGTLKSTGTSQLSVAGLVPLASDGAVDLKLAGQLDVGLLSPLLEARGQRVAGALSVDATVTGTAGAPKIGGTLRLARGELRDYSEGVYFSDITAQLDGVDGMLRVTSFTARSAPGSVSVAGTLGVLQPGLPVDLQVTARGAQPIANPIVTAALDADLHVQGRFLERLDVSGKIRVNHARIGIPNSLPADVAVLDVRRDGRAAAPPAAHRVTIGLDLSLQAPRQVLVEGRGLDAEMGGEMHIGGTSEKPLVTGGFQLQRGVVAFAGNQLTFSTGSVSFNGTGLRNRIDPTLDFAAQTTVAGVTATLAITGLAESPTFVLTSTPTLPQDEILARLLFGKSAAQLAPLQVAQIGTALLTLSGRGGGLDPLARVQKGLGLDRLSFGATGNNTVTPGNTEKTGASLEAGRYVSGRVYVGATQSTTGTTQLQVDVNLTEHLKLQTRLGNGVATAQGTTPENDPGSSVGIAYQVEY
ncbi:MAG: translocation/assembly module TamB domain-containing protein [Gammaproteobacteria bacterium]